MSAAIGLLVGLTVASSMQHGAPTPPMTSNDAMAILAILAIAFVVGIIAIPFRNSQWTARWEMWLIWFIIALTIQCLLGLLGGLVALAMGVV